MIIAREVRMPRNPVDGNLDPPLREGQKRAQERGK
jgi:hypothetical protein